MTDRDHHAHEKATCNRCGRTRRIKPERDSPNKATGLCRDCLLVTSDLGETERWAS